MIGGLQDIVMEGTDDKCVSTMISHFRLNLEEKKVERTETKVSKPRQSITLSCFSLLLVLKLLLFIFDRICPVWMDYWKEVWIAWLWFTGKVLFNSKNTMRVKNSNENRISQLNPHINITHSRWLWNSSIYKFHFPWCFCPSISLTPDDHTHKSSLPFIKPSFVYIHWDWAGSEYYFCMSVLSRQHLWTDAVTK